MGRLQRVSITIPEEMLRELDAFLSKTKYASRSEAIRDALELFLSEQHNLAKMRGTCTGVAIVLYEHGVRGLVERLIDLQHEVGEIIGCTHHFHLSEDECLETIFLRGETEKIVSLVNKIGTLRGVKLARFFRIR